jgi:crotonobetainyl-CoA hydratase
MTEPEPTTVAGSLSEREPVATLTRVGRVAVITLNRPGAMNAANAELSGAVGEAIETLANDPELRVGIITGTGRAFCAGMDLKAFAAGDDVAAPGHPEWGFAGVVRHYIAKPLIAAVNGFALGGGAEIVLACDLVVASTRATFGLPEVKRGLFAAGGGVLRLPRQVSRRVAMELILTGGSLTAQRALELGLVNRLAEPDDLISSALELANVIASNAPLAVQTSKRLFHSAFAYGDDWSEALWQLNDEAIDIMMRSEDAIEGARAFAEQRPAVFTGR